ncbi:N-acetylglucosamine-6-phosphate deacetylase [Prosthecomicrobium pneumaticum]|uniref:N-acetylglucosamine-6-phosphate deacetylase n=2 Tax=Prosthecomicrobium pneumaticum TaxID=81895 RepID=A0A7W9FLS6_9HYPH|nr:N-acetylglucosamine-6-phosphate deacetylase [Prosthecomicrobium pneumaticum]MBB5752966.1 N-acetylglucosamine-6-phosphate deacetylase [Prosthecomicrobium pneumaticum]
MAIKAFIADRLFDGGRIARDQALLVEDGRVRAVVGPGGIPESAARETIAADLVAPGFVDLQVNGGGGVLLGGDTTLEGVRTICATHARHGTTAILPTLITESAQATDHAIETVRAAIATRVPGCLGLHMEGPHLSVARKGAHDPALIRPMDAADFARVTSTGIGHVLLTVAAETVPAHQIARLAAAGVTVSIGHSDAPAALVLEAADAGARLVTHLFNAMSPLGHREPGVVGAALGHGGLSCGLIADGFHVHPLAIHAALAAKAGPGSIFLVSDAMHAFGAPGDTFTLNGRTIYRRAGRLTLEDGTLAGADIDLAGCVRFLVETVGVERAQALAMATALPAKAIGAEASHGRLAPGTRADFVALSADHAVTGVWVGGEPVAR